MPWKAVAGLVVLMTSFSGVLHAQDAAIIVRTFNNFRVPPGQLGAAIGGDVVLRLHTAADRNGNHYRSLGFALVGPEGMPFLATVYADLSETIARKAGVDASLVLGRVIAHEVGHLLLNSNAHSEHGLMRAGWTQRELRSGVSTDCIFLEPEARALRAAATRRRVIGE